MDNQLWSASEVWVFSAVHDKIMGACKQMFTLQDASMDSILSKLEKVERFLCLVYYCFCSGF